MSQMTSSQPYLLRAIFEWIIDNGMTPQLVVSAADKDARIPQAYIENDRMVLNIHPAAVRDMDIGNQSITFNARFGGAPFQVFIPMRAVIAIYARENGKGLVFSGEADADHHNTPGRRRGPNLTVIK